MDMFFILGKKYKSLINARADRENENYPSGYLPIVIMICKLEFATFASITRWKENVGVVILMKQHGCFAVTTRKTFLKSFELRILMYKAKKRGAKNRCGSSPPFLNFLPLC